MYNYSSTLYTHTYSVYTFTLPWLFLVHLIGKDGDRIFDERDVKFTVGEGEMLNKFTYTFFIVLCGFRYTI